MWGNRLGWVLAALAVAVICIAIGGLSRMEEATPPTALSGDPANLEKISLPVSPEAAWPQAASEDRDAGAIYLQVINDWDDPEEEACQRFVAAPFGSPPELMTLLLKTRDFGRMRLFQNDLGGVINYDNIHPQLDALTDAGEAALNAGLAIGKLGKPERAVPYLQAGFNLGRNLYNERITYAEFQSGMQLMADAVAAVRLLEPQSPFARQLADFDAGRIDYVTNHVEPIWRAIDSADPGVIAANTGDVFVFAQRSQSSMWRVEAVLKLGRLRFDVSRYGDEALANRLIDEFESDPDPAVAAAARAAHDLTIEKYRQLGGPG